MDAAARARHSPASFVGRFQALYYLVTGAWPVVHMESFLWVTGDKTELWLVRTFGVLIVAIGIALWYAARTVPLGAGRVLGVSVAVALAAAEVVAWATGAIGAIYLADAALHVAIVAAWAVSGRWARAPESR